MAKEWHKILFRYNIEMKRSLIIVLLLSTLFVLLLVLMFNIKRNLDSEQEMREVVHTEKITQNHIDTLDYQTLGDNGIDIEEIIRQTGLTTLEIKNLLNINEGEKLSRDVYTKMFAQWGDNFFVVLKEQEEEHKKEIETLLTRYMLGLYVTLGVEGEFNSADTIQLYQDILSEGGQSMAGALTVSARIEELRIRDLRIAQSLTQRADILGIYQKLETGSKENLKLINQQVIDQTGTSYLPRLLPIEEFVEIVR